MLDTKAFRSISYGLYVITSKDAQGRDAGCIVNTFQQVASKPPTVSVSLNKDNATTKAISESGRFCAAVLAQSATMELIGLFGFRSSFEVDKFTDVRCDPHESGIRQVAQDVVAYFYVEIDQSVDVGSHVLFIGTVKDAAVLSEGTSDQKPITYAYYHEVLRGKTPPKAASYEGNPPAPDPEEAILKTEPAGKETSGRIGWRCALCGYVIEMDELPDDFRCPICGVDRSFFERIEIE